jgi:hypothetical protein
MAPTQRPFFANFFSAFRARTNPTFQAKSSPANSTIPPGSLAASAHVSTTTTTVMSNPRSITTKAGNSNTQIQDAPTITSPTRSTASPFSAAAAAVAASSHRYASPYSRSPGTSSPGGPHSMALSPPGTATPLTRGRQRRESDSSNSSGGFMDALGPENKWYIGGRTVTGEEKFYRLGLVTGASGRRVRSLDRLSL